MNHTAVSVSVYGDCKTVIQQMQGRSRPRKLRLYHERAMEIVDDMRQWNITFEHRPRAGNQLCDRLCAKIAQDAEVEALEELLVDLDKLVLLQQQDHRAPVELHCTDSPRSELTIEQVIGRHFQPNHSLIPYSKRPFLYQSIAAIANASSDFVSMIAVGEKMEYEAKIVWSKLKHYDGRAEEVLVNGINYQIEGLANLRMHKDADRLKRRHKALLERNVELLPVVQLSSQYLREKIYRNEEEETLVPGLVSHWDSSRRRISGILDRSAPFWIHA